MAVIIIRMPATIMMLGTIKTAVTITKTVGTLTQTADTITKMADTITKMADTITKMADTKMGGIRTTAGIRTTPARTPEQRAPRALR